MLPEWKLCHIGNEALILSLEGLSGYRYRNTADKQCIATKLGTHTVSHIQRNSVWLLMWLLSRNDIIMAIVSCIDLQVCPLSCGQLVYHFGIEIQKTRIPSKIHHQILRLPVIHQKTEHRSVHRERGVPPRISTLAHHCCCSIPTHTHNVFLQ